MVKTLSLMMMAVMIQDVFTLVFTLSCSSLGKHVCICIYRTYRIYVYVSHTYIYIYIYIYMCVCVCVCVCVLGLSDDLVIFKLF